MTEENKDLLIKDLSARLGYGVKFKTTYKHHKDIIYELIALNKHSGIVETFGTIWFNIEDIKPCLRPMNSMTEEEYSQLYIDSRVKEDSVDILDALANGLDAIDWLNAHHFDYRGLIEKGLALEAPKDMYK